MNTSRFSALLILVALLAALPTVVQGQGQQGCSIEADFFDFNYKAKVTDKNAFGNYLKRLHKPAIGADNGYELT